MSTSDGQEKESVWEDDLLEREKYADFLTTYLISRTKDADGKFSRSFTLALDAQWGQGKTFFVERWAKSTQGSAKNHPTLVFDCWKADYSSDPVVAFMAAFKGVLDSQTEGTDDQSEASKRFKKTVSDAVRGIRKAVMPAGKEIVKGLLRKGTGIVVENVIEAYGTGRDLQDVMADDSIGDAGLEAVNKGLDVFFARALEDYNERQKTIGDFKEAIAGAIKTLADTKRVSLPMFVFIDELDRCRPDFALALLEGVKHLFDIPGVCFVVSTNMAQLSEAVKALYGPGFNGKGYLKRLFDAEYALPVVGCEQYIGLLLDEHVILKRNTILGLPVGGFDTEAPRPYSEVDVILWVANVFSLDLRSQRKVVETASAAASGIKADRKTFLLWLAILCAIRHVDADAFDDLASSPRASSEFSAIWKKIAVSDRERSAIVAQGYQRNKAPVTLESVAWAYYHYSWLSLNQISDDSSGRNYNLYPASVAGAISAEMPGSYMSNQVFSPSIRDYFELVRSAGHLAYG